MKRLELVKKVMPKEWFMDGDRILYQIRGTAYRKWNPETPLMWKALIEFICNKAKGKSIDCLSNMPKAIRNKDTDALEKLAMELMG